MKIIMPFVVIVICALFTQPALSKQGGSGKNRWYTVELVLFTRNTAPGASGEIWTKNPGELGWDSVSTGNFASVSRGNWRLTGSKLALKRAEETLTPVIHTAWQQPVYSRKSARSFYLKSDREIAPGTPLVEGMVKVSVSRYLHIDLDLLMRGTSADSGSLPGGFRTFRFNEHRRMRSKELHYIDHPLMGMLVLITPHEPPNPPPSKDDKAQQPVDETVANEPAKPE